MCSSTAQKNNRQQKRVNESERDREGARASTHERVHCSAHICDMCIRRESARASEKMEEGEGESTYSHGVYTYLL